MADTDCTYVFVGYSGAPHKADAPPKFESDEDPDRTFFLTGKTLGEAIKQSFPTTRVIVQRAWAQSTILDALSTPGDLPRPIRQIHFVCHGGSWVLSLAYKYAGNERLEAHASTYFKALETVETFIKAPDRLKLYAAMKTLEKMDPLVAGYFATLAKPWEVGGPAERAAQLLKGAKLRTDIKTRLMEDAYVHVWGCFSGAELPSYVSGSIGPKATAFFAECKRLFPDAAGIARELAMELEVPATAVDGPSVGGGLMFLKPTKDGGAEPMGTKEPITKPPVWMWRTKSSKWVTWNTDGKARSDVLMFQKDRTASTLDSGKEVGMGLIEPPTWLLQAHTKATLK